MPLTKEQFDKLDAQGFTPQEIASLEQRRMSEQKPQQANRFTLKSEQPYNNYSYGDAAADTGKTVLNSLANVGDSVTQPIMHPIETLKNLLSGAGQAIAHPVDTAQGIASNMTSTDNPDQVPNWAYNVHTDPFGSAGNVVAAGAVAKSLPALGKAATNIPRQLKPILKFENSLQQAQKAKSAFDAIRTKLGEAVDLNLRSVAKVQPKPLKIPKDIADHVVTAIKKQEYGVEFTKGVSKEMQIYGGKFIDESGTLVNAEKAGQIVPTIENYNKIKKAIGEYSRTGDFSKEAGTTLKTKLRRYYGYVNGLMKQAAKKEGKDISGVLDNYDKFMDKFDLINPKLVDAADNALGNKLKAIFKLTGEPLTKQAWKDVSKVSPEIKQVMNSMKRRELLKNLLIGGATLESGKRALTGQF